MSEPMAQTAPVHVAQTAPVHVAQTAPVATPVTHVANVVVTAPVVKEESKVEEKPVFHKEVWKGPIPPHVFANGHVAGQQTFHGWNPPKK